MTTENNETTDPVQTVRAKWAVELLEHDLPFLQHPNGAVIRLVQFSHDSPGLRAYKRQVCEALVYLVESNGGYVFNGLDHAVDTLRQAGYTVTPPTGQPASQTSTEPLRGHP